MRPLAGTERGRAELGTGAGGDRTMELDRAAEYAALGILERVAATGATFSVLSEELGTKRFGADLPMVLIDPVDGSLNAKLGVPVYGLMLALAEIPAIRGVTAGYVRDLATGQVWEAARGGGARLDGATLVAGPGPRPGRFRVLGLETSARTLLGTAPLIQNSSKVRLLGSMALSIVMAATGAFDVFCSAIQARCFDMAASLLILREMGGTATALDGSEIEGIRLDLAARSTLLCSADAATHRRALELMALGK